MKKLLREPLVHFLLLGAALFAAYSAMHRGDSAAPQDIVITNGQIKSLAIGFTRVWQRPPTSSELKGLIDGHVKEEILVREAVKLGLDRDDPVIRRRLQQKMDFIVEDFVDASDPTEGELADYLTKHSQQFAQDQRFTFQQVFFDREKHGDRLDADVVTVLATLKQQPSADIGNLGNPLLLPQECADVAQRDVAAQFGQAFATSLGALKLHEWSGPIESGYGVHLVRITERIEGRQPTLGEVRDQVKREFLDTRRAEANQRFFANLLAKYHVTIEQASPDSKPVVQNVALSK